MPIAPTGSSAMMGLSPSNLRLSAYSSSPCCSARSRWGGRCGCGTLFSSRRRKRPWWALVQSAENSTAVVDFARGRLTSSPATATITAPYVTISGARSVVGHDHSEFYADNHACPDRHDYDDGTGPDAGRIIRARTRAATAHRYSSSERPAFRYRLKAIVPSRWL